MTCEGDCCKITMPLTPKEIKENYLDEDLNPFDVFALSIGKLTLDGYPTVVPALVDICWRRFRNRPIGDYDYLVWFEALDDKVNDIWYSYKRTIPLFMNPDIASTVSSKETVTETVVNDRDALTTQNLTTTNNLSEVVDETQITGETVLVENEDNPDSEAGVTKYLSNRSNTDRDVTVDNDSTVLNTGTVGNSGTIANTDDSTVERDSVIERKDGLFATTALEINDAIREGFDRFLDELEPLFLNRW